MVFKYEARPKPNLILVSNECAKSRAGTFRFLTEVNFRSKFRFFFKLKERKRLKKQEYRYYNSNYRGVEESRAQQQTGQVRLAGETGNTLPPTAAVNNSGAALASASVNIMEGQDTLRSSRQAVAATMV